MTNKEYNGGTTMKLGAVNLWMDNNQGSHEMWRRIARESIDADEGTNWFLFEDKLKEYLDFIQEDLHNGVASGLVHDLLGGAISEVNTREIAMHWVADELENMEITE